MKNRLHDRIRQELKTDAIENAPESFYQGVWHRIRYTEQTTHTTGDAEKPLISIGLACWRSVPVFCALLLAASIFFWYNSPDSSKQTPDSAESYVLDAGGIPDDDDLLYQIIFPSDTQEPEKNP